MTEQETQTSVDSVQTEEITDNGDGSEVDKDLIELYDKIQKAQEERDQIKDQLLRTMADFQNFRKRAMDEKRQIEERANERFVAELLPVLDNFERGLAAMEKGGTVESLIEGVKAIDRQLKTVLESQKVRRIESVGKQFDPELHEALASVESAEHEDGTIVEEIEPGYLLGTKVVRPARVRVSKKP